MAALESELISEDPHVQYIHKNCQDGHISDRFYKNGGCLLPTRYKQFEEQIYNMEVRPDDVWVLSFPKCGTTWTQEMVWLIGHDFDFEAAKELLDERFVFLEFSALGAGFPQDSVDKIVEMKSPRFIKSHLPLPLLPKQFSVVKPKTIYVYRNPKDAAISYYHHFRMWNSFSGSLEKFLGAFVQDKVMYLPFWDNVIPFWKMRKDPNILFITYEDMKKDLYSVVKRTAHFLGVNIKEEVRDKFLKHLSFEEMKKNPSVNYEKTLAKLHMEGLSFMREGQSGGWSKVMSEETVKTFDEQAKKALKGLDFPHYK